ncbi:hypothetical protein [Embleya scabrispora]|uniref:hypothetical protein n=1 Tax=Embleya scabrispora TaxID=159449 RepID=UPI001319BE39|nr:hypothetical protein [Embleya scabrispora]MYS86856.1 hypothetical protein [Streptomyces sp. SID5474]
MAVGESAVTTGMRLREFTTLLDIEVDPPRPDGSGARVRLHAVAKYGIPRDVVIRHEVLRSIDLYRRTERARAVKAAGRLSAREADGCSWSTTSTRPGCGRPAVYTAGDACSRSRRCPRRCVG